MIAKDIDITDAIRDILPIDSFIFNPSFAHLKGDLYIMSVRAYLAFEDKPFNNNPNTKRDSQHPWASNWSGEINDTFVFPIIIAEDSVKPVISKGWPIRVPVQDARVFRFVKDGDYVSFILTYNERYVDQELLIKGGDYCDDFCFIIGWSYLLVNENNLSYSYVPGKEPLCSNISDQINKNWSLFTFEQDDLLHLCLSYMLTPLHQVFTYAISGVEDGQMIGAEDCQMATVEPNTYFNIFKQIEEYYDNQLITSLSTPSYLVSEDTYQSVGHMKVKYRYIKKLLKEKSKNKLARFAKKYVYNDRKKSLHGSLLYFMFIYQFKVFTELEAVDYDPKISAGREAKKRVIPINRVYALITSVSPAFVVDVDDYDYLLNFPAGMVINDKETIISYGNGDYSSHLLYIDNDSLDDFLVPVSELTPSKFKFIHSTKEGDYLHL